MRSIQSLTKQKKQQKKIIQNMNSLTEKMYIFSEGCFIEICAYQFSSVTV